MRVTVITEDDAWRRVVSEFPERDVYHDPDYTAAFARLEKRSASPLLLTVGDGKREIAWPVIARECGPESIDLGSAYGYPGPLFRGEWTRNALDAAWSAVKAWMSGEGVVSVTARLHPLSADTGVLEGLGSVRDIGETVSIPLRCPEGEQVAYRENHRRGIRKLRKLGVECRQEPWESALAEFSAIYRRTMNHVEAGDQYFFADEHFVDLCRIEDFQTRLYVCRLEGEPVAAGMFFFGPRWAHYHLGGTEPAHYKLAPTKLMFDVVRHDAAEHGLEAFHLGGGVGGHRDSLFEFKRGFSNTVHRFRLFTAVIDRDRYDDLSEAHAAQAAARGRTLDNAYFPRYRAPMQCGENE